MNPEDDDYDPLAAGEDIPTVHEVHWMVYLIVFAVLLAFVLVAVV